MKKPVFTADKVLALFESRYINVYDLQYAEGKHYLNASRRKKEDLLVLKPDTKAPFALPDAVTLVVILRLPEGDRLLSFYEYRYPTGQFLLSPPAGLIDPEDRKREDAIFVTAVRELYEETGITYTEEDIFQILNPCVYSSPGMTDESNALALFIIQHPDPTSLTDQHTTGSELFDGFCLLDKEEAKKLLKKGQDTHGIPYSVYTWQMLLYFISDLWKEFL